MKINCNYISKCLERAVDVTFIIPSPSYPDAIGVTKDKYSLTPEAKYPVLYLLHGIGNNKEGWLGYTRAELYAEENNIAIVCISAENKFYTDRVGEKWEEFIREELPQLACGYFPISGRREDTYIAGLSMGGYGAVFHALSAPEKYAACGSFSGAIEKVDLTQCIGSAEKYDILSLLKRRAEEGAKLPLFYLSCGENDFIYDNSVRLEQAMTNLGVAHRWESVEGFTHEWRFWDMQLERFIKWLPRTDYYKGKVRNV